MFFICDHKTAHRLLSIRVFYIKHMLDSRKFDFVRIRPKYERNSTSNPTRNLFIIILYISHTGEVAGFFRIVPVKL